MEDEKSSSFLLAQGLESWGCLKKLVCMYDPLFNPSRGIRNKADAMQFAINATMKYNGCHEASAVDYDEAEKLFNFICDHVQFPEEATKQVLDQIIPIIEGVFGGNSYDLASELSKLKVGECAE